MKVTFSTSDPELYRALKVQAAARRRPVREIVEEALRQWLERQEETDDRDAAGEALQEYEREGGVAAAEYFEHLAAELRAEYHTKRE